MKNYFYQLADFACSQLKSDEYLMLSLTGEVSDFVRFTKAKIRQCGAVKQGMLTITLNAKERASECTLTLSQVLEEDKNGIKTEINRLRNFISQLPIDPHLVFSEQINSSEIFGETNEFDAHQLTDSILSATKKFDMVGILATGCMYSGFANSLGQRNWFESVNFNYDFSLYLERDRAVKGNYAGFKWNESELGKKIDECAKHLDILAMSPKELGPGSYRVYLSPNAVVEMLSLLNYGGFSYKSYRACQCALQKLYANEKCLSNKITLFESSRGGLAPHFNNLGYIRPDQIMLINGGRGQDMLVSPRSGKEYQCDTNGALPGESPESLVMNFGTLEKNDVLSALDCGLYINHLHYLNFSDLINGRITGMTRFATFWVEKGKIDKPVNVIRFDDTIYHLLGSALLDLTREREFIFSELTYYQRSRSCYHVPGMLLSGMNFTF